MRLIGINGFKTAGKDTAYDIIKEIRRVKQAQMRSESGWRTQRAGFADKLKIMAAKALGMTEISDYSCIKLMNECKENWQIEVYRKQSARAITKFTGREYLQWFGGEARTVFGENFWIDQVLPNTTSYEEGQVALHCQYPDTDMLVITDVRYPNEAQRVKDLGGEIWEVVRPGLESDGHGSETPLTRELVDLTIVNDTTIGAFAQKIKAVL